MKIKLLKKVRRRYKIVYYPTGTYIFGNYIDKELMLLFDNKEERCAVGVLITPTEGPTHLFSVQKSKQEAKDFLMKRLLDWIKIDYDHTKQRKQTSELIWYK